MDLEILTGLLALLALIILGVCSLFGVANITLAIVLSGLYIGSNTWLGLNKIANKMPEINK